MPYIRIIIHTQNKPELMYIINQWGLYNVFRYTHIYIIIHTVWHILYLQTLSSVCHWRQSTKYTYPQRTHTSTSSVPIYSNEVEISKSIILSVYLRMYLSSWRKIFNSSTETLIAVADFCRAGLRRIDFASARTIYYIRSILPRERLYGCAFINLAEDGKHARP